MWSPPRLCVYKAQARSDLPRPTFPLASPWASRYLFGDAPAIHVTGHVTIRGRCGVRGDQPCTLRVVRGARRLFEVGEGGSLTLESLRLQGGTARGWGGALRVVAGAAATLRNVTIEDCTAGRDGTPPPRAALSARGGGARPLPSRPPRPAPHG